MLFCYPCSYTVVQKPFAAYCVVHIAILSISVGILPTDFKTAQILPLLNNNGILDGQLSVNNQFSCTVETARTLQI